MKAREEAERMNGKPEPGASRRGSRISEFVPATVLRPPNFVYMKFSKANDLAAFFKEMQRHTPTPDESLFMSLALRRCNSWVEPYRTVMAKSFPDRFDFEKLAPSVRRSALAAQHAQCNGFNGMGLEFPTLAQQLMDQALAGKSMSAIALSLPERMKTDSDAAARAAREIMASGDSYAVSMLWGYLVADRAYDRMGFERVNLPVMQEAWFAASCETGIDCGPDSQVMRDICVNQGICDGRPYIEYVRLRRLSPDDFVLMDTYRAHFLAAMRSADGGGLGIRRPID